MGKGTGVVQLRSLARLSSAAALFVMSGFAGATACEGLVDGPRGTVTEVVDGDTVMLDSGIVIRLIGIQAPKLPLGRDEFETWPLADEARDELVSLLHGDEVILRYAGARMDRHDRALGHLFRTDGTWAQEEMLRAGMARVYSFPDNRMCLDELYQAEYAARTRKAGIWDGVPYYAVRQAHRPETILAREGSYELVEGRVLNADRAGSRIYLNFGRVWKEDFTVVIERSAARAFAELGLDPLSLENQLVRVRGWIEVHDGPRIDVTHPEQIELLAGL